MSNEPNELDALAGEAQQVDLLIAPVAVETSGSPGEPGTPQVDPAIEAVELAAILQAISSLFVPVFPSLATIYTPDVCNALATATIPVMQKHGWSVPGIMADWAEEIALATVALPLGFATWQAVKADVAKAEKAVKASPEKAVTGETAEVKPEHQLTEPVCQPRG